MAMEHDVDEQKLHQQWKYLARYEEGGSSPEFHSTAKESYQPIYCKAFD